MNGLRRSILAGACLCLAAPAGAQVVFQPVMCTTCPAMQEMPFQYSIGDAFGGQSELPTKASGPGWSMCPGDPAACSDYLGNTRQERRIVGNQNIKQFDFSTWGFDLEAPYDYVEYGHRFWTVPSPFPTEIVNGRITDSSGSIWWRTNPLTKTLQDDNVFLRFVADGSVEGHGLATYRARVCCAAPQTTADTALLIAKQRVTGFLLGTNDVVDFSFFAGYSPDGSRDLHQTVALWADPAASASDFDLYIRCNAKPTPTAFDFRGFTSDPTEFAHLTPDRCPGGIWFVTVHSFRGAGQFNIVQHNHRADAHFNLHVAFDKPFTEAQRLAWESYLTNSARYYFGLTEGGRIIDTFYVHHRTDCPSFDPLACGGSYCNLCINPDPCPADPTQCIANTYSWWPRHIQLYSRNLGSPGTLPHELGHYDLGLPDEYKDEMGPGTRVTYPQCGHTVMGLGFAGKEYNFCYDGDHTLNRIDPAPAGGDSDWRRIGSTIPPSVSETPDDFPYVNFPFPGFRLGWLVDVTN